MRTETDGATALWIPPAPDGDERRWVLDSIVVEPGRDDAAVALIERGLSRARTDGVPAFVMSLEQRELLERCGFRVVDDAGVLRWDPVPGLPYTFRGPLRTERLVLRAVEPSDLDAMVVYHSNEDVARYLPNEPRTRDEVAEKIAKWSQAMTLASDKDFWQLALERADAPGRVIGDIFFAIRSLPNSTGEIGWSLNPEFGGRGYMTEAARAILGIAFDEIGLRRVFAQLDPRNASSAALCRRLGMREEAYFVEDLWFKGEWGDTSVYGLLAREFRTP